MASHYRTLKEQIAASLYIKPASLSELAKRDFLSRISEENIDRMLQQMENDKWIFFRNRAGEEIFHTYKEFALSHRMREYELREVRREKIKRMTAEQAIDYYNRKFT